MTHLACFSAFCFVLLPIAVGGQVVRGRVTDGTTSQPVPLAGLELMDARQKTIAKSTADSAGTFRLRAWGPGKYHVRVTAFGYRTVVSDTLEVAATDELELNVRLGVQAVPMQPVAVVARSRKSLTEIALRGYYDRRDAGERIGMGRFLDRNEIEQLHATRLSDVLRRIPGFRIFIRGRCVFLSSGSNPVGTGRLDAMPRNENPNDCSKPPSTICAASIYLDGSFLKPDQAVGLDQIIPIDWVEAIEAYRRPSELPAEFLGIGGACGVVALWTRRG